MRDELKTYGETLVEKLRGAATVEFRSTADAIEYLRGADEGLSLPTRPAIDIYVPVAYEAGAQAREEAMQAGKVQRRIHETQELIESKRQELRGLLAARKQNPRAIHMFELSGRMEDISRLETSLRFLQQEQSGSRLAPRPPSPNSLRSKRQCREEEC